MLINENLFIYHITSHLSLYRNKIWIWTHQIWSSTFWSAGITLKLKKLKLEHNPPSEAVAVFRKQRSTRIPLQLQELIQQCVIWRFLVETFVFLPRVVKVLNLKTRTSAVRVFFCSLFQYWGVILKQFFVRG